MVRFEELNAETVQQYRNEIAQFYYGNMLTCSCLVHYTFDQAYEKIGDLIAHLTTNTCIAYGAFEEKENDSKPNIYCEGLCTIGEKSVIPDNVTIGKNTVISGVTVEKDYKDGKLDSGKTLDKAGD